MTYTIILALSTFLISLVGTRMVIATLRKLTPPEFGVVMGKSRPAPLRGGGFALLFALVIGLLGSDVDYTFALSIFLLAGLAMLGGFIKIPDSVEFILQVVAVCLPLAVMKDPIFGGAIPVLPDHIIAGGLWLLLLRLFVDSEHAEGVGAIQMVAIGLGVCVMMAVVGLFPHTLSSHSIILAMAGCGALWWSWPPAKILLGKIGMAPAGLVIGYVLLLAIQQGFGIPALILCSYVLLEGLAPRYFRVMAATISPTSLAHYIAGGHMLLVILAVLAAFDPGMALFNLFAAYVMVTLFLWFFTRNPAKKTL